MDGANKRGAGNISKIYVPGWDMIQITSIQVTPMYTIKKLHKKYHIDVGISTLSVRRSLQQCYFVELFFYIYIIMVLHRHILK